MMTDSQHMLDTRPRKKGMITFSSPYHESATRERFRCSLLGNYHGKRRSAPLHASLLTISSSSLAKTACPFQPRAHHSAPPIAEPLAPFSPSLSRSLSRSLSLSPWSDTCLPSLASGRSQHTDGKSISTPILASSSSSYNLLSLHPLFPTIITTLLAQRHHSIDLASVFGYNYQELRQRWARNEPDPDRLAYLPKKGALKRASERPARSTRPPTVMLTTTPTDSKRRSTLRTSCYSLT